MRIQYASDLHLEFYDNETYLDANKIRPSSEILILAGDILLLKFVEEHESFFDYISNNFKETYWIPGNHEYYHSDINLLQEYKKKSIRTNIHLVNNEVISINNVNLIFSTLWSHISPLNEVFIKTCLSDFSHITIDNKPFLPEHFNAIHTSCLEFIETTLKMFEGQRNVIFTHHAPTYLNYPEIYSKSRLNEAFATELKHIILNYQPEAWIYGHTHVNVPEFKIGKTRLVTNQLGYIETNEHHTFKFDTFIEI
jgi:predicted phosphohydrolase